MSATKILWGQVITVFLIVLAGVWGATQWTAAALAYQTELGPRWFMLGDWRVYPPPAFFLVVVLVRWLCARHLQDGRVHRRVGGFVSIAVAIGMSVWRARELKNAETYDSARWASAGGARGRAARAERRRARQARPRLSAPRWPLVIWN